MIRRLLAARGSRLSALAAGIAVLAFAAAAVAFFTDTGTGSAAASVGAVNPPANLAVQQSDSDVTISWDAATLSSGDPVQGYTVARSDGITVCGSPTPVTTLSCTDSSVPAGSYTYTVTAVYSSFTASATSDPISVLGMPTINTTPSDPSAATAPSFTFSGGGGSGYQCQLDGGSFTACTSPQSYSGLADGSHTFKVHASSGSSTGPDTTYTWTIDSSAPQVTAKPGNPSANTAPSFSFTHTQAGYTFKCQLDGAGYSTCTSPDALSGLANGQHRFNVEAVSADGASTASASYTWTVNPPPSVTSTSPSSAKQGAYQVNVTITGANFASNASVAFSNPAITVNSVQYVSSTALTANITIARTTTTGAGDVTVTNPGGTGGTGSGVFTVNPLETVYVANAGDNTVTPIAATTDTTEPNIAVGGFPFGLAVTPDGEHTLVANQASNTVSVIDASHAVTKTISGICQGPDAAAITSDGKTAYFPCFNGNNVSAVDVGTETVKATIPVGSHPVAVATAPDGKTVYVANASDNTVSVISTSSNTVTGTISGFSNPGGLAITPDGKTMYVSNNAGSTVVPVTLSSLTLGTAISVGNGPDGLALTPDGTTLYVSNINDGTVSAVTTASRTVAATIAIGGKPNTVVVNPEGTTAYVGQYYQGTSTVTPVTVSSNTTRTPINVGSRPESIAIDGPLQIGNAATLPSAQFNQSYSQPLWSLDGTAPFTYSVTSGSLPDGLSLSSAGVISGTPTTVQTKTFTVSVTDSSSVPQTATKVFTLSVIEPPTQSLTLAAGASDAYVNGTTVYYAGNAAGSLKLSAAVTAYATATPASASFPAIATTGWTHNAEAVATPSGGPFTSSTFSWSQNPTNPSGYSITGTDSNGTTVNTPLSFVNDTTAPTGGALSVNGTAATGGGSSSLTDSSSFTIGSRTDYTETQSSTQSGLRSSTLSVQSEAMSGSVPGAGSCGAPGSGGPFTVPTTITSTTQQAGILAGYCYLYTLTGTDNVGNTTSISTTVTVAMKLWAVADSITQANGSAITTWADSSPFANTLTTGVTSAAPTLYTNVWNGHAAVQFNGSNADLQSALNMSGGSQPYDVFVVAQPSANISFGGYFGWGNTATSKGVEMRTQNSPSRLDTNWYYADDIQNNAGVSSNAPNVIESFWTGSMRGMSVNGRLLDSYSETASDKQTAITPFRLGESNLSTACCSREPFSGKIAEVVVYEGVLNSGEQTAITSYLKSRYAIP
jgi:YVTN family beta-propeller protein